MDLGWQYISGTDLSPEHKNAEREYLRYVVLTKRLNAAIKRLNPWISNENLRNISREITHPSCAGLMEYNHEFYQKLTSYLSVDQGLGKGRKGQTVKLIDFDQPSNNEFICTNQFKVEGEQKIIPDIICFVNGLPLVVIECKSPYISNPISEGINQRRRYADLRNATTSEGAQKLFWYNQLMVSACRDQAKVGTISSSSKYYGEWKDAYPYTDQQLSAQSIKLIIDNITKSMSPLDIMIPDDAISSSDDALLLEVADKSAPTYQSIASVTAQQRLLSGMFNRDNFLDIVQNFIIFETDDGRLIKKVARYQQFRAVNKVIERLKNGNDRKERSGVVWHTQGSGKSLTMVMLAVKMRRDPKLKQYKLIFITDRTQLDEQLSTTFRDAQGETVYNANSVKELKELLKKDSSDLVTAMVQKFADLEKAQLKARGIAKVNDKVASGFEDLNPSDKIIVLADEAHRTQFGGFSSNAAMDPYIESALIEVCKSAQSNNVMRMRATIKGYHLSEQTVATKVMCNGADIISFAQSKGAYKTAARLEHNLGST